MRSFVSCFVVADAGATLFLQFVAYNFILSQEHRYNLDSKQRIEYINNIEGEQKKTKQTSI